MLDRPFLVEKTEMMEKGARMLESKYFDEQLFKNCLVKLSKFEDENLRFSISDMCSHFRKPQVRPRASSFFRPSRFDLVLIEAGS